MWMESDRLTRWVAGGGAGLCLGALAIAVFFMEWYLLLEPCPLCILDRFAVAGVGVGFAGVAIARRAAWRWGWWGVGTVGWVAGAVFAVRHVWLQNRPPEFGGECLSDHAAAQGVVELVRRAFDANADCGAIMWEFAGLTIPEQVLALLAVLAVLQGGVAWLLWRVGRS